MAVGAIADRLSVGAKLGYAAGSFGMGVYSTVPGILLLYYMTQQLGLPAAVASLAVLAPKLVVLIVEPVVGAVSDRLRSPWGRRRPFLVVGAVLSAATFVLLFNTPRLQGELVTFLEIAVAYLGATLAFSIFAVPYVAMPAEFSTDPGERARIVGLRMIFVYLGVLAGSAAPPLLVERLGGGGAGYGRMAVVIASASLLSMLVAGFVAPDSGAATQTSEQPGRGVLLGVLGFGPFTLALGLYVLIMAGSSALTAAAPYFVTYVLDAPQSELAVIFTTKVLAALGAMTLWAWLTPRLGFSRTLAAALVLAATGAALLLGARSGERALDHLIAFVLIGAGSAGVQVAAFALLADVTSRFTARRTAPAAGVMTGLWTASEKIALALGPALTGALLAIGGFVSAAPKWAQPPSALTGARLAMGAAPAAIFAVSAVALLLTRKVLDTDTNAIAAGVTPLSSERAVG